MEFKVSHCPEMIKPILKYGASELVKKSLPISRFDEQVKSLAEDLLQTMYSAKGIGLAAPQVGVNLRLLVVDITGGGEQGHQIILANPIIAEQEGTQKEEEGCLSIPGFSDEVERPSRVIVEAQDLEGKPLKMEGEQLLARVLCHEIDHLDGILYLDRISALKRDWTRRKIRKLIRAGEW